MLTPLIALVALLLLGWGLVWLFTQAGPDTYNPNSCSSCSPKQGGQDVGQDEPRDVTPGRPLRLYAVAPGQHRLRVETQIEAR